MMEIAGSKITPGLFYQRMGTNNKNLTGLKRKQMQNNKNKERIEKIYKKEKKSKRHLNKDKTAKHNLISRSLQPT